MASSPHPYIANTDEDRRRMLDAVGVASSDELFADIPPEFRIDRLDLPPALSELELTREMADLASKNVIAANGTTPFLGAGAYRHFLPSSSPHVGLPAGLPAPAKAAGRKARAGAPAGETGSGLNRRDGRPGLPASRAGRRGGPPVPVPGRVPGAGQVSPGSPGAGHRCGNG